MDVDGTAAGESLAQLVELTGRWHSSAVPAQAVTGIGQPQVPARGRQAEPRLHDSRRPPASSVAASGTEKTGGAEVAADEEAWASRGYKYESGIAGEQVEVLASYVVSPASFYVHQATSSPALDAMMDQLNPDYEQIGAAARSSPQTLSVGQPCCALYAADGRWYSARLVGSPAVQAGIQLDEYLTLFERFMG